MKNTKLSNLTFKFCQEKLYFWAQCYTMLHEDENNNVQTTLYRKLTDKQAFLHAKSEHSRSLKNSARYS